MEPKEDFTSRSFLLLSLQRAMWGCVGHNLVTVRVLGSGAAVRVFFEFAVEPTSEDLGDVDEIMTGFIADFPFDTTIEIDQEVSVRVPGSPFTDEGHWCFVHKDATTKGAL